MPKQKTHKGLKKRVRISANGKVKRKKAGKGHLMSHKSGKRRRSLSRQEGTSSTMARKYKQALGLG